MNKLDSSYAKFMGYKVACIQCDQLYIKQDDEAFVCLTCLSDS